MDYAVVSSDQGEIYVRNNCVFLTTKEENTVFPIKDITQGKIVLPSEDSVGQLQFKCIDGKTHKISFSQGQKLAFTNFSDAIKSLACGLSGEVLVSGEDAAKRNGKQFSDGSYTVTISSKRLPTTAEKEDDNIRSNNVMVFLLVMIAMVIFLMWLLSPR